MFDQLDIFASQIFFRFNKQATYKTRLGSFVSLIIIFLIIYKLVGTMLDLIQKNNPQVIYNDRQVDNPAAFIANSKTFPIAFGMERPIDFTHYIDESIYTVSAFWKHKIQTYNETTQQYVAIWNQISVDVKPCTIDNFQNPDNQKYYLSLNYTDMYCLPPDLDLTIQGDFPSPEYSEIELIVKKCTQNCQPQEILDQFLLKSNFGIQMSDSYVDPSITDNPFKIYSRDMFWSTSTQLPKDVFVYIRNNYVYSDFGLIFSDIKTQKFPSYSFYQSYEFPPSFQDYFLSIHFRFETQKEGVYKRSYKKFNSMISEIGGYIQSFLAIGYLFCRKASQIKLDIDLISKAFKFQENKKSEEEYSQIQKQYQEQSEKLEVIDTKNIQISQRKQLNDQKHKKKEKEKTYNVQENQQKQDEQNSNFFNYNSTQNYISKSDNQQKVFKNSQIIDKKSKINLNKQDVVLQQKESNQKNSLNISNLIMGYFQDQTLSKEVKSININEDQKFQKQKSQKQKIKKQQCVEETLQNHFESKMNNLRISTWDYLKSQIFCYFSKFYDNKKKIINYSREKLYNYIDLFNIINKMNEIEKLKRLILDEDQLKLFDYIPKPTISASIISKLNKRKEADQLYQDTRSELQKASDSFKAYQSLIQKCELTTLDQKLINQIDPDLKKIFQDICKKQDFQTNQLLYSEDNKQTEIPSQIRQSIYFKNQHLENQKINRIQRGKDTFKIELITDQTTTIFDNQNRNQNFSQFRKFDEIKESFFKNDEAHSQLYTNISYINQNDESHLNEFQYKSDSQKPNTFRSRLNQLSQL